MAEGKVGCACGKQYTWKPELAGKRAKCKCGNVVTFPAVRPGAEEESPDGIDEMGEIPMAPPPPPPPLAAPPPPPPPGAAARANLPRGRMPKSGGRVERSGGTGFTFSGKALWNIIVGVGIIALGIFLFVDISNKEQTGDRVRYRGRRMGWLNLLYALLGKWGILGLLGLIGLGLIVFAVMVMLGRKAYDESE